MIADYSFAYIYLYRDLYGFEYVPEGRGAVTGCTYDSVPYIMPVAPPDCESIVDLAVSGARMIFPVDECCLEFFKGIAVRTEAVRGDADYIYSIDKLKYYAGRKLHGQKNLLNQFFHRHSHEIYPLNADNAPSALDVLDLWQDENGQPPEKTDYRYCREGVLLMKELYLTGYLFLADGKPAGFLIGEIINGDTFAVLFAKGLRAVKGIYQFMNSSAAHAQPEGVRYFNFQQDMDIEGLRRAKMSYNPDMILDKYRVYLR